ncbi:phosphoenolpyruvate--protein phosphotransferase [Treponema phagedenis]|uniref:phosphoenolpyruvate--protein phosphotransferase n=1 Tax=Treponema phagedenis TaxID=162 RepID=UPI0011EC828A|nr:phosphoenolpyruvate--protein phosphotransferase [Treponema phagedenis]TYT78552.1 phosphoenolpyruvate--protein phosphotransferase [Treponema phagedenis]
MVKLTGLSTSGGIGIGVVFCPEEKNQISIPYYKITKEDVPAQVDKLKKALTQAQKDTFALLEKLKAKKPDPFEYEILNTHYMMLSDENFISTVIEEASTKEINIESALQNKLKETISFLTESEDPYLQARAVDIKDAFSSVFEYLILSGKNLASPFDNIPQNAIIVAKLIKPSDAIRIKNAHVAGIVMEEGGATGHIAILARSWGIPMIVGVDQCTEKASGKTTAIIDAGEGLVIFDPSKELLAEYTKQKENMKADQPVFQNNTGLYETTSKDGVTFHIEANIALAEEVSQPAMQFADGIGLFRSEFLILDNGNIPSEESQYQTYQFLLKQLKEKPVIIRTFDIGADKTIDGQAALAEKNPLLGLRGIRYCLEQREVFKVQLRALLRAGVAGNLFILLPMISSVSEIIEVRNIISAIESEFNQQNIPYKKNIPVGIMVEVPSVAVAIDLYAPHVDFMSIGTNDLVQYTLAADRENAKVQNLADYFHPSVLYLIENVIQAEKNIRYSKGFVSMCGDMASHEEAVFLLAGMGLRNFSMPIGQIPAIKTLLSKISVAEAEKVYQACKTVNTPQGVRAIIARDLCRRDCVC